MSVSHLPNQSAEEIIEKNSASLFYTMTQTYEQHALYIHTYANTHTTIHKYLHAYTCKDTYINTYQYLNTLHTHHAYMNTHTHTHPNAHTGTIFEHTLGSAIQFTIQNNTYPSWFCVFLLSGTNRISWIFPEAPSKLIRPS